MRRGSQRIGEWSVALFLFGALAFSPPLLSIFSGGGTLFGLPLLFLYLFAVWGLLIFLLGRTARAARRVEQEGDGQNGNSEAVDPLNRGGGI